MGKKSFFDKTITKAGKLTAGEYEQCCFKNCKLGGANLSDYIFTDCTFIDCDLSNAKTDGTAFTNAAFKNSKLVGVLFEECRETLFDVRFKGCDLSLASFRERKMKATEFKRCRLIETDFTGADLRESTFSDCDLDRAVFERSDLRKVDFRGSVRYRFSPEDNRIRGAKFSPSGLTGLLEEYGIVVD